MSAVLSAIGFVHPWLLLGLLILPLLWLLLRAIPPAPIRRRFPAIVLLLGLADTKTQSDRTPWWLMLLRLAMAAAAIIGFAEPVLNADARAPGTGALLVVVDAGWADAPDWDRKSDAISALLGEAQVAGRPIALVALTDPPPGPPAFRSGAALQATLDALQPQAWRPDETAMRAFAESLTGEFETRWFSDGLQGAFRPDLLRALESHGAVRVVEPAQALSAISGAKATADGLEATILRSASGALPDRGASVQAIGLDPSGDEGVIASAEIDWEPGQTETLLRLELRAEQLHRVRRVEILGSDSAGAVFLTGNDLKRREFGLVAGDPGAELPLLLSAIHYLREALGPESDIVEQPVSDVLLANPDVIIFADVARLPREEHAGVANWVREGGKLIRFAGPLLAASELSRGEVDELMPVRLRTGGRQVGGTMSWGEPKHLAACADDSPFFGLIEPAEVSVAQQVLAQPSPELSQRVLARLEDGTPLVTRKHLGNGEIVLFHVTADAEWSNLPLSELFLRMLERLARTPRSAISDPGALHGTFWQQELVLDAYGRSDGGGGDAAIPGEALTKGRPSADLPPGIYSHTGRIVALNALAPGDCLCPAQWPAHIEIDRGEENPPRALKPWLILAALVLLGIDTLASLALCGTLRGGIGRKARTSALMIAMIAVFGAPPWGGAARADADEAALLALSSQGLGHVLTGNARVDRIAERGLAGLSRALYQRSSVEPGAPIGIDLESDEIAFLPLLYWPITQDQALPSPRASDKINRYLKSGGLILFDTRDADLAKLGAQTSQARRLREISLQLDIPPLEPIPEGHVLGRAFYLLSEFPGRYRGRRIWVQSQPPRAAGGSVDTAAPDRTDGVTPVVIGGNDWAAAWAIDDLGDYMLPLGRGSGAARQREIALRFGVNLVMHALTGNYKADQVHVPALLERLGQ